MMSTGAHYHDSFSEFEIESVSLSEEPYMNCEFRVDFRVDFKIGR